MFKRMWSASIVSQFGTLIQSVGAAWLMVQLGGTNTQVALVTASITVPILILALLSGALADNYPRRIVMLCCQIGMFLNSITLCIFAWMGWLTPWLLLMFTFLNGCGLALAAPSLQATVGDIVPRGTIARAVAMNSMGVNIARSAGPALGGVLVAMAGAAAAFTFNAFSYLSIIFVLFTWDAPKATSKLREDLGTAMAAGLRYASMSTPVRTVVLRAVLTGIAASSVTSLMPLVAKDLLGGDAAIFGLLSGVFGVGAVLGALSNRHLRARFSSEWTVRIAALCLIGGAIIVSESRFLPLTLFALLFSGAGWLLAVAVLNVVVQMSVPRWVVGRSLSLYQMAIFGSMSLGSFLSGKLSETYGVTNALLIMAGIQAAGLAIGLLFRLPESEDKNLDPVGRWRVPDLSVEIDPRSGPIHVTVRYDILPDDLPEFVATMKIRRQIRVRDGAQNWNLSRDLQQPNTWVEHYRFSRWRDYILHNERHTHEDDESLMALKRLHQGDWPPEIHRSLERQMSRQTIEPDLISEATIDPTRGN
tara:strand:+ start:49862 stop:51460 length:1599 start_codon:yes stop_codon:yes gene_type:complete